MADSGDQDGEFPIVCETCLGDNPFVRMTKEGHGKACKICDRPFTVFRWRPGARARFKKTEICQTCSKMKNVCQTCILDLRYGLPVQVRDQGLAEHEKLIVPKSSTNRDYVSEQFERQVADGTHDSQLTGYGKAPNNALLNRLSRRSPYYKRNLPHICSFWVKGDCSRGDECPYRHEKPITGELANQNIKDRFYGVNDPVAKKMMRENEERLKQTPGKTNGPGDAPDDKEFKTIFVGGVDHRFTEDELREKFSDYGIITNVTLVPLKGCGFVTMAERQSAEKAVKELHDSVVLHGIRLRIDWGKQKQRAGLSKSSSSSSNLKYPLPPGMKNAASRVFPGAHGPSPYGPYPTPPPVNVPPPPGMSSAMSYPSMNPHSNAAKMSEKAPSEKS